MPDVDRERNLPSTYQQVLENMRNLTNKVLPIIDKLSSTVFNPTADPGASDVVWNEDEEKLQCLSITINTDTLSDAETPGSYTQDVTFQLKDIKVLDLVEVPESEEAEPGLGETPVNGALHTAMAKKGFSTEMVAVMTFKPHFYAEITNLCVSCPAYPAWQLAIGDMYGDLYYRAAINDNVWGNWVELLDIVRLMNAHPEVIQQLSHRQIILADDEPGPDEQEDGDYWIQTVYPADFILQDADDMTKYDPVHDDIVDEFVFEDLESGGTISSDSLDNFRLFDLEEYVTDIPQGYYIAYADDSGSSDVDIIDATSKTTYVLRNIDSDEDIVTETFDDFKAIPVEETVSE